MNKFYYLLLLPITLLTCLWASPLSAQAPCVTFDSLEKNRVFSFSNTGSQELHVTTEANFRVLLRPFPVLSTSAAPQAKVLDAGDVQTKFPRAQGNALQLQSSLVDFRWAAPNIALGSVCFDIWAGDGTKTFSVNGLPAISFRTLDELHGLVQALAGVKVYIFNTETAAKQTARICIDGPVSRFTIGGEQILLDNICHQAANTICPLEGRITGLAQLCGDQVKLELQAAEELLKLLADTAQIQVELEGFKGFYSLRAFPVTIPLRPSFLTGTGIKVRVCLPAWKDCCTEILVRVIRCQVDNPACIEFEGLKVGETFGKGSHDPGALAFVEDKVPVSVENFLSDNGAREFGFAEVSNDLFAEFFPKAKSNRLMISNVNLKFNFSRNAAEGQVRKVCFDYADGGGVENIRVNNGRLRIVKYLSELDKETLADGVIAYFTPSMTGDLLESGTLCLVGPIDSLFIGGQEFGLDNICFDRAPLPVECSITDLTAGRIECDSTGKTYSLTLNAKVSQAADSLTVKIEKAGYKMRIAVKDLPVRLQGIPATPDDNDTFTILEVCADQRTDVPADALNVCCAMLRFPAPNCVPPALCEIEDVKISEIKCDDDGKTYSLLLNASAKNAGDTLTFFLNNINFRYRFAVKDLPVRITGIPLGPLSAPTVLVAGGLCPDKASRACCAEFRYQQPVCQIEACSISEVQVHDILCSQDGKSYSITVSWKAANTSDSLSLVTRSGFKTTVAAGAGKVRLEGIPVLAGSPADAIEICSFSRISPPCCGAIRYEIPCVPRGCSISDIKVSDVTCDTFTSNARKTYSLTLSLNAQNAGDSLIVTTSGGYKAKIAADKFPVRLRGIPVNPSQDGFDILEVCASTPLTVVCCNKIRYEVPCAKPRCEISGLRVTDIKCDPEKKIYSFTLHVAGQNLGEVLYLESDSGFRTKIEPKALPVRVENVPFGPEAGFGTIQVCSSNADDCCAKLRFALSCPALPCAIGDIKVSDVKCSDDGRTYSLSLQVASRNAGDSLIVTIGNYRRIIPAQNAAVRLENIPRTNTAAFSEVIQVCAAKVLTTTPCCAQTKFEIPCRPQPCTISDLKVADIRCSADGRSYSMSLFFKAVAAGDSLLVETQSGYRKVIPATSPVRLENIPVGNDPVAGILTLCAFRPGAAQCCDKISYELPCRTQVCNLSDLKAEPTRCDDQGKFAVVLNFNYKNTSDSFLVLINGRTEGKYAYKQLPLRIGPFQGPLTQPMNITIYDSQNRACALFTIIQPFRCEIACQLSGLRISDLRCNNTNGTYSARINLNAQNSSEFLLGKTSTGFQFRFKASDMPLRIEGIPVPRGGIDVIQICDPNKPDCCTELRFKVPCQEACYLGALSAEQICLPSGLFNVQLNFGHQNAGKQFSVTVNGVNYGIFSYDRLPIQVGPFYQRERVLEIKVEDMTKGCSTSTRLVVEPCATACNFNNLKAEVLECSDGRFFAGLSFQAPQSDMSRAYLVFVNGRIFGPYPYSQNPIRLGPFAANGVTQYNFLVIDVANPTCYAYTSIRPVTCAGEACKVSNLIIKPVDCNRDGSQRILVDFDYDGVPANGTFALSMNNELVGVYPLARLPLEVNVRKPLSTASDRLTGFSVCIRGAENCCTAARAELLECPQPCKEPDVVLDRRPCTPNGVYSVALKAGPDADSNYFYAIFLDGKLIDTLRPEKPLVTINALKGDGATTYTLEIVAYGTQRCIKTLKLGPVNCLRPVSTDVWPGDANQDNIANYIDLLNIGVAFGAQGPARRDQSADWKSTPAENWDKSFGTGQNFKHADTNGDGVVDEKDILVVTKNYGKTHGTVQMPEVLPGTSLDPAILVELPSTPLPAKGLFEIPIKLGTREKPVRNIYGMAFTLKVNPDVIDLSKIEVVVPTTWMGRPGVNLAHIHRIYPEEGLIEIAITRIDQNEVSGYGEIAYLRGGIKDDIAGRHTSSDMNIRHGAAVRLNQETVPISGSEMTLHVAPAAGTTLEETPSAEEIRAGLRIFPNPLAGDQLNVRHLNGLPVEEIQIIGLDGKAVSPLYRETNYLDVSNVPGGVYLIRVKVNGYIYHQKLVRQR